MQTQGTQASTRTPERRQSLAVLEKSIEELGKELGEDKEHESKRSDEPVVIVDQDQMSEIDSSKPISSLPDPYSPMRRGEFTFGDFKKLLKNEPNNAKPPKRENFRLDLASISDTSSVKYLETSQDDRAKL